MEQSSTKNLVRLDKRQVLKMVNNFEQVPDFKRAISQGNAIDEYGRVVPERVREQSSCQDKLAVDTAALDLTVRERVVNILQRVHAKPRAIDPLFLIAYVNENGDLSCKYFLISRQATALRWASVFTNGLYMTRVTRDSYEAVIL